MNVHVGTPPTHPSSLRRLLPRVLPVLVLLGGVGAFVVFSSLQPARPAPTVQDRTAPAVQVISLEPRTVTLDVVGHGSARARDRVQLASEVAGRVAFVASSLRNGSFVAKDEVLVRLDDRDQSIAQRRAQADVARANADLERLVASQAHLEREVALRRERVALALAEYERQRGLESDGVSSPNRIDQARSQWIQEQTVLRVTERALDLLPHDVARARAIRAASSAALEQADLAVERLVLRAPISGQVRARQVDVGQVVSPGMPLVGLTGFDVYEVPVQLSHDDLFKLQRIPNDAIPSGIQAPPGRAGSSPATVTWPARPGVSWKASLTRIESVDSDTRTIPAVVEVTAPWSSLERGGLPLLPGAYCRVQLLGQTQTNAWVVPEHALREGHRVFVLREGRLAIVRVRVEHLLAGEAVISPTDPLLPGDRLIVNPIAYPVVGMRLRVETSE